MCRNQTVDVVIMLDGDHKESFSQAICTLEEKGFVVDSLLTEIAVLTGSMPADALGAISAVPGVLAFEKSRSDYRTQSS
ncbi:MAG: hypothetical protein H7833_09430 [Magnetococcus sp. DMHC-1]